MKNGENLRQMYCDFWDDPEGYKVKNSVAPDSWKVWLAIGIAAGGVLILLLVIYACKFSRVYTLPVEWSRYSMPFRYL